MFRDVARLTVLGLGLSLSWCATLVQAETVSLRQAYDRMMSGEIEFQILDLEQEVAREVVAQARGAWRPRAMLTMETNRQHQDIVSSDNQSYDRGRSQYDTHNVTVSVVQPIYDAARWRQLSVAEAERALIKIRAELARNDLISQMSDSFINVAAAQYSVHRARQMIRARHAFVEMLDAQAAAGRVELGTLLRAEGEILAAEADRTSGEIELTDALFALSRFVGGEVTGVSLGDNQLGAGDSASLRRSFTAERLEAISPQIQLARAELDVARKQLHVVRAGNQPVVNLNAEIAYDQTSGSLFGGGSSVRSGQIGFGLDVPIYQGGVHSSRLREEEIRTAIAERRLELTRRVTMRQFESILAAEARASARVAALIKQRGGALDAVETAQREEAAGRVGADVALERQLSADLLETEIRAAQLQQIRLQLRLYALFGALDVHSVSRQISG